MPWADASEADGCNSTGGQGRDRGMWISTVRMTSRKRVEEITKNTPNYDSWMWSPSFSSGTSTTTSCAEKCPTSSPHTCQLYCPTEIQIFFWVEGKIFGWFSCIIIKKRNLTKQSGGLSVQFYKPELQFLVFLCPIICRGLETHLNPLHIQGTIGQQSRDISSDPRHIPSCRVALTQFYLTEIPLWIFPEQQPFGVNLHLRLKFGLFAENDFPRAQGCPSKGGVLEGGWASLSCSPTTFPWYLDMLSSFRSFPPVWGALVSDAPSHFSVSPRYIWTLPMVFVRQRGLWIANPKFDGFPVLKCSDSA